MDRATPPNRAKMIFARVRPPEHELVLLGCAKAGTTVSELVRQAVLRRVCEILDPTPKEIHQ